MDLTVFTGDGLEPGIDLADRATWGELIEAEDAEQFHAVSSVDQARSASMGGNG